MDKDRKRNAKIKKPYDSFLSASLKIPADVLSGEIKLTLVGNRQALLENYQGLSEYDGKCVTFQGKRMKITVEGEKLRLDYYGSRETLLRGRIRAIRFEETERGT